MPYFYFVKSLYGLSPRVAYEWPPIGGEPDRVQWKIEIPEKEAKRRLSILDYKYRKQAEADLHQED
jgi:hypothetical protein